MFCHNRQTLAWRLNILAIPNNPLIFFKGIDIGTERYYPVGVESLLNTLLFKSRFRHMREAEVDAVTLRYLACNKKSNSKKSPALYFRYV